MNKSMLGVIDATTHHNSLKDLLMNRSLAAVPVAGRYRLIDFILSNMVNSGIHSVAIFPKYQYRSLMDHLGSGKNWDLNRKRDGLFFFPAPAVDSANQGMGSFNHFAHHMDYFQRSKQKYALISNCNTIFTTDFTPLLKRHMETGCDITKMNHEQKPMDIYLLETSLLIELIETRGETGYTCMEDVVKDQSSRLSVCDYEYLGYVERIECIQSYFNASMKLLKPDRWKQLFRKEYPVLTKVKDEPPTRYQNGATVKNAIIANGCFIEGNVSTSTVFRGVRIGTGSKISNSIIMQKSQIGDNCVLEYVILDKDVKIEDNVKLAGTPQNPIVIRKGMIQGALMNS
ncbi:glucose-1-phosphate adenylyltransferase [Bacillus salacetis]|uniref:Glucose-1-phosphate adenylyltransferase n=1 Tax=Bacillus salacetis TaxID=2315464 RepID=A0A3A1R1L0_9BACI|nr:sugar phosphate nucleotidyltransferase [Bacillus salacetis]RIW35614.1 glucose-1-phosphate adenylyltransferase [Bacillus salacetis]